MKRNAVRRKAAQQINTNDNLVKVLCLLANSPFLKRILLEF